LSQNAERIISLKGGQVMADSGALLRIKTGKR